MAVTSRLEIHDGVISLYVMPGGEVDGEVNSVVKNARRLAEHFAPERSGALKRGIKSAHAVPYHPLKTSGRVSSTARHTLWVHDGTSRIYPHGPYLLVPKGAGRATDSTTRNGGAGTQLYRQWKGRGKKGARLFGRLESVRGQRAQPFLAEALVTAMGMYRGG